jgi:hypothetical protein
MKWQCALLQRWLPEYPDGDLPGWGKRWLEVHVAQCSTCRQELAELREVVAAIKATPVGDPGTKFWSEFSRDLHLQLVQAAQEDRATSAWTPRRWSRWPYLLGAPALAALLLWMAVQLTGPGKSVPDQALVKKEAATRLAASPAKTPAPASVAAPGGKAQVVPVALEEGAAMPMEDVDISGWDLDSELAGMTDQEKETFLKKLHQHGQDGSCLEKLSWFSWA